MGTLGDDGFECANFPHHGNVNRSNSFIRSALGAFCVCRETPETLTNHLSSIAKVFTHVNSPRVTIFIGDVCFRFALFAFSMERFVVALWRN